MDHPGNPNTPNFPNHPSFPCQQFAPGFPQVQTTFEIILNHKGTHYRLPVQPSSPIREVKMQLETVLGIPRDQQSIWFNGTWLKDYFRVRDYQIAPLTELYLYKRTHIVVRTHIRPIHMMVDVASTVQSLKESVYHELGARFPLEHMKLWLGDTELMDGCFLRVYHISDQCELSLKMI